MLIARTATLMFKKANKTLGLKYYVSDKMAWQHHVMAYTLTLNSKKKTPKPSEIEDSNLDEQITPYNK